MMCMGFNPWCQAQCRFRATGGCFVEAEASQGEAAFFWFSPPKMVLGVQYVVGRGPGRLGLFSWIFRTLGLNQNAMNAGHVLFCPVPAVWSYEPVSLEGSTIKIWDISLRWVAPFRSIRSLSDTKKICTTPHSFILGKSGWKNRLESEVLDLISAWNDFWTRWAANWAPAIDRNWSLCRISVEFAQICRHQPKKTVCHKVWMAMRGIGLHGSPRPSWVKYSTICRSVWCF